MSTPGPRRFRFRPFARLWHRWFGLIAGLWLLLLAVTGSAIAFYDELDTALNPDLRSVVASQSPAPVGLALRNAEAALPGFHASQIDLPDHVTESLWLIGRAPGPSGKPRPVQVFADPADGRILGWRDSARPSLDRRHLLDTLYGLHVDLLIAPWVSWLFGLIGLLWVFDHMVSAALSFPKLGAWRESFAIAGRRGSLRQLFDLHRATGLWLFPVTLTLAFTGVTLAWPETSRTVVGRLSPVTERLHEDWPEIAAPTPALDIDEAMRRVAVRPRIDSVRPLPAQGVYAVRTFHARDPDNQGRLWTYVSMADGRILGARHDNGATAGDLFFAWQYPLHSGHALGVIGRGLVALAGVATALLVVSGLVLWLRRRPGRKGA